MGIQRSSRSSLQELLESQAGGNAPGRVAQTKLPILPPPSPSDLSPLTIRERGSRGARRWWKQENATPPRRLSPKEGLNKREWGKQRLIRDMTLKLDLRLGPLPLCWTESPYLPTRLSGSSSRGELVMLPMQWNKRCCFLVTWLTLGQ